jgi:hypothetical protein
LEANVQFFKHHRQHCLAQRFGSRQFEAGDLRRTNLVGTVTERKKLLFPKQIQET